MRAAQYWGHGTRISLHALPVKRRGQMFYAGIVVEIVGLIFYRKFPPAKKSDSDKEYRLEPMKIDDNDSQKNE